MTIEQEMWEDLMLQVVAESRYPKRLLDRKQLLKALRAFKRGDFSVRLPVDLIGADGEIATTFNDVVELNEQMTRELERISSVVGKDGRISQRGKLRGATGSWEECIDSVNTLIGDLVQPITEVARVIGAVAKGDLSQTMLLEIDDRPLRGEFLRIAKLVNPMSYHLNSSSTELTPLPPHSAPTAPPS